MKARSILLSIQEKVETGLDRMITTSIIKPIYFSEWASVIVLVLKRNGQVVIFGDFKQTVNFVLQIDKYPIPNIKSLRDAGFLLRGDECEFKNLSISYLGHRIDSVGINLTQEKSNEIHKAPTTKNV